MSTEQELASVQSRLAENLRLAKLNQYEPVNVAVVDQLELPQVQESYGHYQALIRDETQKTVLEQEAARFYLRVKEAHGKPTPELVSEGIGLLTALARSDIPSTDDPQQQATDERKLQVQLQGTTEYCLGNFAAVETSDGKSSVMNPEYLMLRAMFTPPESGLVADFGTANDRLVKESVGYFFQLRQKLMELLPHEKHDILQRTLTFSDIPHFVRSAEIGKFGALDEILKDEPLDIYHLAEVAGVRILLLQTDDLIHNTQVDPEFVEHHPHCVAVLDELHTAEAQYVREPGATLSEEKVTRVSLDNHFLRSSLGDYVLGRLVAETLGEMGMSNANYHFTKGVAELSDKGRNEIINLAQIIDKALAGSGEMYAQAAELLDSTKAILTHDVYPRFALSEKGKTLLPDQAAIRLWREIAESKGHLAAKDTKTVFIKGRFEEVEIEGEADSGVLAALEGGKLAPFEDFLVVMAEEIAQVSNLKKGRDYLNTRLLRDRLRGIALPNQRYASSVQFFLDLVNHEWHLPFERTVGARHSFASWVVQQRGRMVGTSGNLINRDPQTQETSLSSIGKLLEKKTQGKVVDLHNRERKFVVPEPELALDETSLVSRVMAKVKAEPRPELILCWDDSLALSLLKECEKDPAIQVQLVLSDEEQEAVEKKIQDFGQNSLSTRGKKRVIISSGMLGLGVNIKSGKRFPDLKVTEINPETISQIWQGYSRRRLEITEKDTALFFDVNHLTILFSHLEENPKKAYLLWGKKYPSFTDAMALLEKYKKTQNLSAEERQQLKSFTLDALRFIEEERGEFTDRSVDFELFFDAEIKPLIIEAKKKEIESSLRFADSYLSQGIEKEVQTIMAMNPRLSSVFHAQLEGVFSARAISVFCQPEEMVYEQAIMDYQLLLTENAAYAQTPEFWQVELKRRYRERVKPESDLGRWWSRNLNDPSYLELNIIPQFEELRERQAKMLELVLEDMKHRDIDPEQLVGFAPYETFAHVPALELPGEFLTYSPKPPLMLPVMVDPPTLKEGEEYFKLNIHFYDLSNRRVKSLELETEVLPSGQLRINLPGITQTFFQGLMDSKPELHIQPYSVTYIAPVGSWQALKEGKKTLNFFLPDKEQYRQKQRRLYHQNDVPSSPSPSMRLGYHSLASPYSSRVLTYSFQL